MKTILFFFTLMLLNSAINAQNLNENRLIQTIDSLQNIIDGNNRKINTLKTSNLEIENELKKYNSQLNEILLKNQIGSVLVCTMGTLLYDTTRCIKSLSRINRGDRISVVETLEEHYKVFFNGMYGYVLKSGFKRESEVIEENKKKAEKEKQITKQKMIAEQEKIKKEKQLEQQRKLAKEKRKKELINKYGQTNGTKISAGYIWIGMTDEMARTSWGNPDDVNRTSPHLIENPVYKLHNHTEHHQLDTAY